jgi:hypothetical protein
MGEEGLFFEISISDGNLGEIENNSGSFISELIFRRYAV